LLGEFNAKLKTEDIFKPTIGNEDLRKISDDNGVESTKHFQLKNINMSKPHHSQIANTNTLGGEL
jgi:hypothetical protein